MNRNRAIIRLLILLVFVPALFVAASVSAAKPVNDVQYTIPQASVACSCLWAIVSNSIVSLLQTNTYNFLPTIAENYSDCRVVLVDSGFISFAQLSFEDMCYSIFKPPKM